MMKSYINKLLRKHGLKIQRFKTSPYEYLLNIPRYHELEIELFGHNFKIADSLSFYCSFREIFLEEIYKFNCTHKAPIILDCGSNYGTSIVYFKSIYPDAKIIAVEPDPIIFSLLEWNIKQRDYKDITLINKAISNSDKPIKFYHEGADGGRIFPNSNNKGIYSVNPIRLDEFINGQIDFLKMDIEGYETEVIGNSKKLENISQLFIEYHSFKDSRQTLDVLLNKLSLTGFKYYIHTQFCSPRPLTEEMLQLGMDLQLNIFAKK